MEMSRVNMLCSLVVLVLIAVNQGLLFDILESSHVYELFPMRKLKRMIFQWDCSGWSLKDRSCEEKSSPKIIRFYRKQFEEEPEQTLLMEWYPEESKRTLYLTADYQQVNDYIEMKLEVPLDMLNYDYASEKIKLTNISIDVTGSHIVMRYNDLEVCSVWLRGMNEDISYSTHIKLEKGFYFSEPGKKGTFYWRYRDEVMWCWENCSQPNVYNFSGYYDQVLSPRTYEYKDYRKRDKDNSTKPTFCTFYNCTMRYETHPRCLFMNFTARNETSGKDQILLDLRCANSTPMEDFEIQTAKEYWKTMNVTIKHKNNWTQKVPDDPTGVGIVNGTYRCLQRDYCHDLRPFQLFNFEGSAHVTSLNLSLGFLTVVLVLML